MDILFSSSPFRNRRSGQGDRLSGVSVTLHYGSESEDDPVMSGEEYRFRWKRATALRLRWRKWPSHLSLQAPCPLKKASQKLRVRTWAWATRSSSCSRPSEAPGTARARSSPIPSSSSPPAGSILTTISRSNSPFACSRSGMMQIDCFVKSQWAPGQDGRTPTGRRGVLKEIHWPRWTLCVCVKGKDEERGVRKCGADWFWSQPDVWECKAVQHAHLKHLQASVQASADHAGNNVCFVSPTGIKIVVCA